MRALNITLAQSELCWQDPAANRAYFDLLVRNIDTPTDMVVLPEMFTTGFTMDGAAYAETMDGPTIGWMGELASATGIAVCGSLIVTEHGRVFNRFVWSLPDGELGCYDKRHLFRMADEHHHYSSGDHRAVFTLHGWRICPLICYDLRFPVWSRGINTFDLLLYVANWPAPRRSAWRALLPARAIENQCYVAGVNRTGTDGNGVRYAGDSAIVDYLGDSLAQAGAEAGLLSVSLDGDKLLRYREKFPAWQDADRFTLEVR